MQSYREMRASRSSYRLANHVSSCKAVARAIHLFSAKLKADISVYEIIRSNIVKAPGQFRSCSHSNNGIRYGANSLSDRADNIFAQLSQTLFPYGLPGCKKTLMHFTFLADSIASAWSSMLLFQSSISMILSISNILFPSIPLNYDRFDSLSPNRIRSSNNPIL